MKRLSPLLVAAPLLWAGGFFALPAFAAPPEPPALVLRSSVRAVVTASGEAYLPGAVQMVAPAQTSTVLLHPQGRYALVLQNEAAAPPGAAIGKSTTGATTLLLYDARQNKTKTLWESRADSGRAIQGYNMAWLPGSDCAVVVTIEGIRAFNPNREPEPVYTRSLLFFNFEKSLSARTLLTTTNDVTLNVSPTKPVFVLTETDFSGTTIQKIGNTDKQVRMGTVRGTLSPALLAPSTVRWFDWSVDGTTIYGSGFVFAPPVPPDTKPARQTQWYEWDGKGQEVTRLSVRPVPSLLAKKPEPLVLPFSTKTVALSVPTLTKNDSAVTLHSLYLHGTDTAADAPNYSVLLAPDADAAFLLADKSAVLYLSGGALYAVPLTHLSQTAFADAQKAALRQAAISNAKQVGLAILGYLQDDDEKFPPQNGFKELVSPYVKNAEILNGFTYVYPGLNQASMENVSLVVIGYVTAPGGRAVLYADGHVKWKNDE